MVVIMDESPSFPRPSFYLAIRLASIVQKFRHRLQERVQVRRKNKGSFGAPYHRGLRLRAFSNLESITTPRRSTVSEEPSSAIEHVRHGQWVNTLLKDLDEHTHTKVYSLTKVAASDQLLLSHSNDTLVETATQRLSLPHAAYLFDLSSLLIDRLEVVRSQCYRSLSASAEYEPSLKRLDDEKFVANLIHLLRRLQHMLFQVLVHRSIKHLDEIALHWQDYWQQQKKLGDGWFNEWPDGQHPLSTTWPWNIRPSLVILWGVCWMFYDHNQHHQNDNIRAADPNVWDSQGFWLRHDMEEPGDAVSQAPATIAHSEFRQQAGDTSVSFAQAAVVGVGVEGLGSNLGRRSRSFSDLSNSVTTQPQQPTYHEPPPRSSQRSNNILFELERHGHFQGPPTYIGQTPVVTSSQYVQSTWPDSSGGEVEYASFPEQPPDVWAPQYSQQISQPFYPGRSVPLQLTIQRPYEINQQVSLATYSPNHSLALPEHANQGLNIFGMGDGAGYPVSPVSDGSLRRASVPVSHAGSGSIPQTPTVMEQTTPSSAGSATRPKLSVSRQQEPPRNSTGQIYCDHSSCQPNPPIFRRPCEWNKHMDKHDRPYKCTEPGCDKIQGFTYSGGLLRHQREVHKKNISARKALWCPYPDCNRSAGSGFTRQENLKEHIRRRHMLVDGTSPEMSFAKHPKEEPVPVPRKRKRDSDRTEASVFEEDSEDSSDLREEVKRLRKETQIKDRRLQELENVVARLQRNMPQNPD